MRALRYAAVLCLSLCIPVVTAGWTWPVESTETISPGLDRDRSTTRTNLGPTASSARFLRFRFSADGPLKVVAPLSGRIVLHGAVPDTAEGGTSILFRDENEFWVILGTRRFAWSRGDRSVPLIVTSGDHLGSAEEIDVSVYDRLHGRYVNPRALFPYAESLPEDGIPPLWVVQEREYQEIPRRGSVEIAPGTVQLVSPGGVVDPTRFPKTLYILQGGLVERQFSFLFEDEVTSLFNERGDFVLFEGDVAVGLSEFELEARRFDGTVERRTIRLEALQQTPETP